MSASNHFTKVNYMSGYAKAKGVPFPKLAVAGTGVLLLLGVCPTVGIILLIVFMLGTTFPYTTSGRCPTRRCSRPT